MEELKSLPDWFNGKLFKEVGLVTNPISGESYELNAEELSMYHFIIKLENTRLSKKNSERLCNALIWFVANNANAYNALLCKEDKKIK